jgi:hypothetical protein
MVPLNGSLVVRKPVLPPVPPFPSPEGGGGEKEVKNTGDEDWINLHDLPEKPKSPNKIPRKNMGLMARRLHPTKIDWSEAERRYITANPMVPVTVIAKEFGVGVNRTTCHAADENWVQKRIDFWAKIDKTIMKELEADAISRSVKRIKGVRGTVDNLIKELSTKRRITEMDTNDLARLMAIEKQMIDTRPGRDVVRTDDLDTVVETQIIAIRQVTGKRAENLANNLNSSLKRLGVIDVSAISTPVEETSDGDQEEGS